MQNIKKQNIMKFTERRIRFVVIDAKGWGDWELDKAGQKLNL